MPDWTSREDRYMAAYRGEGPDDIPPCASQANAHDAPPFAEDDEDEPCEPLPGETQPPRPEPAPSCQDALADALDVMRAVIDLGALKTAPAHLTQTQVDLLRAALHASVALARHALREEA